MSLLENFESYIKTRSYAERISISGSGGISFNSTAVENLKLNQYQYASFFYNKANGYVGVKFSNIASADAYHLSPRTNSDGKLALYLSIKGFVTSYSIVPAKEIKKYKVEDSALNGNDLEVVLKPIAQEQEEKNISEESN